MKKKTRSLLITEIVMIIIAVIWFIPMYSLIMTTLKSTQDETNHP